MAQLDLETEQVQEMQIEASTTIMDSFLCLLQYRAVLLHDSVQGGCGQVRQTVIAWSKVLNRI